MLIWLTVWPSSRHSEIKQTTIRRWLCGLQLLSGSLVVNWRVEALWSLQIAVRTIGALWVILLYYLGSQMDNWSWSLLPVERKIFSHPDSVHPFGMGLGWCKEDGASWWWCIGEMAGGMSHLSYLFIYNSLYIHQHNVGHKKWRTKPFFLYNEIFHLWTIDMLLAVVFFVNRIRNAL